MTSVTSVYIRDIPFTYKRNAVTRYYTRYARDVTHMTLHPLHTITLHLLHTVNRVTHITLRHMPAHAVTSIAYRYILMLHTCTVTLRPALHRLSHDPYPKVEPSFGVVSYTDFAKWGQPRYVGLTQVRLLLCPYLLSIVVARSSARSVSRIDRDRTIRISYRS